VSFGVWSGEAREKEAEEGVGLESRQTWALAGRIGAREAFFVDANVHRLDGAERGIDRKAMVMGSKRVGVAGPIGGTGG